MELRSFAASLAHIAARDPRPSVAIGLMDGNRLSLDHWELLEDCVVGHWPNGKLRFLIPFSSIVSVEITDTD